MAKNVVNRCNGFRRQCYPERVGFQRSQSYGYRTQHGPCEGEE